MKKKEESIPIGLCPMQIWLELRDKQRIGDIKSAMIRYLNYDKEIPQEWIEEYKFLIKQQND